MAYILHTILFASFQYDTLNQYFFNKISELVSYFQIFKHVVQLKWQNYVMYALLHARSIDHFQPKFQTEWDTSNIHAPLDKRLNS